MYIIGYRMSFVQLTYKQTKNCPKCRDFWP